MNERLSVSLWMDYIRGAGGDKFVLRDGFVEVKGSKSVLVVVQSQIFSPPQTVLVAVSVHRKVKVLVRSWSNLRSDNVILV